MTESKAPLIELARNARAVSGQREHDLGDGWRLASVEAGRIEHPSQLAGAGVAFRPARVPATVASLLGDAPLAGLDRLDHWFLTAFEPPADEGRILLCLDGLATVADVWLNGRLLLQGDSMFVSHAVDVTDRLESSNDLAIRFHALAPRLRERRARGRWPTRLVSERNLRFFRTSLLGYMPGWCPDVKAVGPWRGVRLLVQERVTVEQAALCPRFDPRSGVSQVDVALRARVVSGEIPSSAELRLDGEASRLEVMRAPEGTVRVSGFWSGGSREPWWPHTHGESALHRAEVVLDPGRNEIRVELGPIGFRSIELEDGDLDAFRLRVNGERVFCRGANWTPIDLARLHVEEAEYREALTQVRDGGMNMLRVGGTTVYESDHFYRLCDELGILVWQDFMFANFDYPAEDEAFLALCRREAEEILERTGERCCIAIACGGSEVQQQAAMMGADRWDSLLFDRELPEVCARLRPDLVYVPSSPSGGDLPFHVGRGPSHYFGVGAYRRSLEDARRAGVRFASECLAFANVEDHREADDRSGVPKDPGTDWDFADVTDHYVSRLFAVDAAELRVSDPDRHRALFRVAPGEVMAATQHAWRSQTSGCSGALVWLLRDLAPGAGWGIIAADGKPKPAYFHLRRAWAPVALWIVDEGLDGLSLHVANDRPEALWCELEVELFHASGARIEDVSRPLEVPPRSERVFNVEGLLGHFVDASYAYRFGPPGHQLVHARLRSEGEPGITRSAFHLPAGLAVEIQEDVGLSVSVARAPGGHRLTVRADRFAQSVAVDAPGHRASDTDFHLAPGSPYELWLRPEVVGMPLQGQLHALNSRTSASFSAPAGDVR